MQYRELGKSGLKVSSMGIGCRGFGRKDVSTADCTATVRLAIDSGISFFDTADIYGDGRSEELLSKGLAGIPRDRYILATKGGSERLSGVGERQNGTPEYLRKSLEQSLRRLRTDHIDLYQLHNPDPAVPLDVTAGAFSRFLDEGIVRFVGVSNMSKGQLSEWLSYIPETVSIQLSYSLAEPAKADNLYKDHSFEGLSLIPWAPLFMGWLVNPPSIHESRHGLAGMFSDEFISALNVLCAEVRRVSEKHESDPAAVALAYVLACSEVATVPVGCVSPAHLVKNLRAFDISLTPSDLKILREASLSMPTPEVIVELPVVETLCNGMVAVLPVGAKIRVPVAVAPGDRLMVNMWDLSLIYRWRKIFTEQGDKQRLQSSKTP